MTQRQGGSGLVRLMLWATATLFLGRLAAADDSFKFEAASPKPYTAAYLGNGLIGLETTALGTAPGRCFVAGLYDHTQGDVPRLASIPAWNEIDVFNGAHWLNANASLSGLEDYHQTLDMYDGVLRTNYVWVADNIRLHIQAEEFVSRDQSSRAGNRVVITPEKPGQIKISLPLRNWPAPQRYLLEQIQNLKKDAAENPWLIWYPGHLDVSKTNVEESPGGVLLSLLATAPGNGRAMEEAVSAEWNAKAKLETHKDAEGVSAILTLDVKPGVSYSFTKFLTLADSKAGASARGSALNIRELGWQPLLTASAAAWHKLWESDIIVEGDTSLQRTIHSMLFYLLGSAREDLTLSIPPMGLGSDGYFGHIFWDADTFMFPPLLILHPEIAHSMVAFRSRTREAALSNAKRNGYQGAMYPWEAGPDGVEATPRFAGQNAKSENHVNGDVALAAWQYWLATGDHNWLEHDAWPILRDTADFWVSRVTYNAPLHRYEVGNVVAVNESLVGVSNDAYTNAVAKKNLELAVAAANALHLQPHGKWQEVSAKMYIPESDSALLWFPLDLPFSPERTRSVVDAMANKLQSGRSGAMMGVEFYTILAAQVGDRQSIAKMLSYLWEPFMRPPFNVISETSQNQNTNFITGAGAFLQQFIFGYPGLRLGQNGLQRQFSPVLPPSIKRLTLKNISIRGKRETLTF